MNCVNFNVSTPNVNYVRLSDESTDKPTEQVSFKAYAGMNAVNNLQKTCKKGLSIKGFFENLKLRIENYRTQRKLMKVIEETKDRAFKDYVKTLSPSVRKELYNTIALDYVAFELPLNVLNKNRTFGSFASLAEQTEKARSKSVGLFFKNFGNLFKNIGKKSKKTVSNQQVVDLNSDFAKYLEAKKLGNKNKANIYKARIDET